MKPLLSGHSLVLSAGIFLLGANAAAQSMVDGDYRYTVENGEATITVFFGQASEFMMIPSTLGGFPVARVGNGEQVLFSNNNARGVVLVPDSVRTLSNGAIYDYNVTYFISVPESVSTIEDGATSSIPQARFAGIAGSPAESYARQVGNGFSDQVVWLKAGVGPGGSMSNSGNYLIPQLLERAYDIDFEIGADPGYVIESVTIDGRRLAAPEGQNSYLLAYELAAENSDDIRIDVAFARDENAVAESTKTAGDEVNYQFPDFGASAGKYANAIGINGGAYYATVEHDETVLYELVAAYASSDGSLVFRNEQEVIDYAAARGLEQGRDYELIHVYNYNDPTDRGFFGAGESGIAYYVAYLYRRYDGPRQGIVAAVGDFESARDDSRNFLNTSSFFAQNGAEITLRDWQFDSYSSYHGPSEGTNFYGAASSLLADGGAVINLVNPSVDGSANIAYATYGGRINIQGGEMLGTARGAHGTYVGYGGQIRINIAGGDDPELTTRPDGQRTYVERNKQTQRVTLINELGSTATPIVTTQNTGTVLATDAGGGKVIANAIVGKAYGVGSAGIYSIGSGEGLIYLHNSVLVSYLDAGIVSASGGYVYANNSEIQGLMAIKLRAGQNSAEMSEVRIRNSQLTAYYDAEEMARVFDVSTPEQAANLSAPSGTFAMNLFTGRGPGGSAGRAMGYWFEDGNTRVPGPGGGNMLAVIYTEGSKTPIYIESSRLVNKNYREYKEAPGSRAQNLLISSEGNGTANVFFINDNSKTRWDLTGSSELTTEITGDFFVAEASEGGGMMDMPPGGMPPPGGAPPGGAPGGMPAGMPAGMPPGGPPGGMGGTRQQANFLNVTFQNSEWEGTVLGVSENANLTFDGRSSWTVSDDTAIDTLVVGSGTTIHADHPVTLSYLTLEVIDGGDFDFGSNIHAVQREPED